MVPRLRSPHRGCGGGGAGEEVGHLVSISMLLAVTMLARPVPIGESEHLSVWSQQCVPGCRELTEPTGRFVVPDVYSIIPLDEGCFRSCRVTLSLLDAPSVSLLRIANRGSRSNPSRNSSMPLSAYFSVVSSILACELSRIYFSSPVGNDGESGSAMASLAKIASSVTMNVLVF